MPLNYIAPAATHFLRHAYGRLPKRRGTTKPTMTDPIKVTARIKAMERLSAS